MIQQYDGTDFVRALQIFLTGKNKEKIFNNTGLPNQNKCRALQQAAARYMHKDDESSNIALPVVKR